MKHSIIFSVTLLMASTGVISAEASQINAEKTTKKDYVAKACGFAAKQACILLPYAYIYKKYPTLSHLSNTSFAVAELALLADIKPNKKIAASLGIAAYGTIRVINGMEQGYQLGKEKPIPLKSININGKTAFFYDPFARAGNAFAGIFGGAIGGAIAGTIDGAISGIVGQIIGSFAAKKACDVGNFVETSTLTGLTWLEKRCVSQSQSQKTN